METKAVVANRTSATLSINTILKAAMERKATHRPMCVARVFRQALRVQGARWTYIPVLTSCRPMSSMQRKANNHVANYK
jgi:hypothetical protein